jgi:hypothetical protein
MDDIGISGLRYPLDETRATDVSNGDQPSEVQKIPTQKMPNVAQVRYFNASDEALANRCAQILQQEYLNARVVRIGLLSPKGQLEVWLPRKGII